MYIHMMHMLILLAQQRRLLRPQPQNLEQHNDRMRVLGASLHLAHTAHRGAPSLTPETIPSQPYAVFAAKLP